MNQLHPAMQAFLDAGNVKPVVHYTPTEYDYIKLNESATVFPVDHTNHLTGIQNVTNGRYANTSRVIRIGESGEFETLNTIYKPVE